MSNTVYHGAGALASTVTLRQKRYHVTSGERTGAQREGFFFGLSSQPPALM